MARMSAPARSTSRSSTSRRPRAAETAKKHPNTCPGCGSHYRDDELDAHLRVCPQCGHHFPVRGARADRAARGRGQLRRGGRPTCARPTRSTSSTCRPYTERLAEAEVSTGLGDAMITGRARDRAASVPARGDGLLVHGRLDGERRRREVRARLRARGRRRGVPLVSVSASGGARMQEGILALMQLPKTVVRRRGAARGGRRADLGAHASDDRRPARELREPRRRAPRRAGRADVVRRPARRRADDAREAARRLRARRVEPPLRPHRRDRAARRSSGRRWRGSCASSERES